MFGQVSQHFNSLVGDRLRIFFNLGVDDRQCMMYSSCLCVPMLADFKYVAAKTA